MGPGTFRFLLVWLIVIHHSFPLRLAGFAAYVFFILTGYWVARAWEEKYSRLGSPGLTFVFTRWWRLAPVFGVCTVLGVMAALWIPGSPNAPGDLLGWSLRQLPIVGSGLPDRVLPPVWSVDVGMRFYLVAGIALPLLWSASTNRPIVLFAFAPTAVLFGFYHVATGGAPTVPRLLPWLGFFAVGACVWRNGYRPGSRVGTASLAVVSLLFLAVVMNPGTRLFIWRSGEVPLSAAQQVWTNLLAFSSALLLVPFVACNVTRRPTAWDRFASSWAYSLCLFHWIPRDLYYHVVQWAPAAWMRVGLLAANFGAAAAGSWIVSYWVDLPLNEMRSRWVARKSGEAGSVAVGCEA